MRIGILTISDRASQGVYEDQSGPALREMVEKYFGEDIDLMHIIPDEHISFAAQDHDAMDMLMPFEAGMTAGRDLEVAELARKARGPAEQNLPSNIFEPAAVFLVCEDRYGLPVKIPGMPCEHLALLP